MKRCCLTERKIRAAYFRNGRPAGPILPRKAASIRSAWTLALPKSGNCVRFCSSPFHSTAVSLSDPAYFPFVRGGSFVRGRIGPQRPLGPAEGMEGLSWNKTGTKQNPLGVIDFSDHSACFRSVLVFPQLFSSSFGRPRDGEALPLYRPLGGHGWIRRPFARRAA